MNGRSNKFRSAVKASGLTYDYLGKRTGQTYQTVKCHTEDPGMFRLNELRTIYVELDDVGKDLLAEAVKEFIFLD
ncbi:hypothetical protein [Berryella intestinalis]|uniref:hypothetical protein n=1 Tax=Berryella intestinalis TaxID=1531429 RepID=UPI001186D6B8|nr:hypothetical protein [Berryella intestinalis]